MNRCPITYELCGTDKYSEKDSNDSPKLTYLNDLPYTAVELRQEAANRAKKAIHSGCTKLSAAISIVDQKIVDQFGTYIIKPQNDLFPQLPENEDVTMRMAKVFGLEVHFTDAIW
jgi:serine/threonine-protein kinase HipA